VISQLNGRMRQLVRREAIEDVVEHGHGASVIPRLERFLAAWNPSV